jgi:hypothetical protein
MLDWMILHAMAHYLPPEAMALLCLLMTAWVVFENWLAKTGKIKANCTLDLVTKSWIAPLVAGLKGMVSKNGTLDLGSGGAGSGADAGKPTGYTESCISGSAGEPASRDPGQPR